LSNVVLARPIDLHWSLVDINIIFSFPSNAITRAVGKIHTHISKGQCFLAINIYREDSEVNKERSFVGKGQEERIIQEMKRKNGRSYIDFHK
jgi:hypothetical protein